MVIIEKEIFDMLRCINKKILEQVRNLLLSEADQVSRAISQDVMKLKIDFAKIGLLQSGDLLSAIEKIVLIQISEMIDKLAQELSLFQLNKGHLFIKAEWKEIEESLCVVCESLLSNGKRIQNEAAAQMNFEPSVSVVQLGHFNGIVKAKLDQIKGNHALEVKTKRNELWIKRIELCFKVILIIGVVVLIALAWINVALFKEVTAFLKQIR